MKSSLAGATAAAAVTRVQSHEWPHAQALVADAHVSAHDVAALPDDVAANTRALVVTIHDALTPTTLERFPNLEILITRSTGWDHVPVDWLRRRSVRVYALAGYATQSVANLTLMMTLALLHRVPEAWTQTRGWDPNQEASWDRSGLSGRHLGEVHVGIWGTGRIGQRVAQGLRTLGCTRLRAFDLVPDEAWAEREGLVYCDSLSGLVEDLDVLTIHVPLTESTRHSVDDDVLSRLRRGAVVVNTARGGIVDAGAVLSALDSGQLSGYAADVLEGEPVPPSLGLFARHPRALLTPHLGAHNNWCARRRFEAVQKILELDPTPSSDAWVRVA